MCELNLDATASTYSTIFIAACCGGFNSSISFQKAITRNVI